ncbi:putative protein N-terminal amidase [Sclerotinia borealis F-4128]|uniref:CN hydrolase domain-containing protein n=1 Tax=Sclerotinia borealis (strain F-4128) TaxID=1432307 RepID=W9C4I1_SCLBF|nr:putative protein N-terminal amidase [Sclerotinia borealis F-4128]
MKIACLQFAPQVGDVEKNLSRADAVLSKANSEDIDLLVLPEMAFSGKSRIPDIFSDNDLSDSRLTNYIGYNFSSLKHITPYLEFATFGTTSLWAKKTALKHNCIVTVGYPEKVDPCSSESAKPEYYNSTLTVNKEGKIVANYRKSFLYYTDETWAHEGSGFFNGHIDGLGNVAIGICMDLNPYKFEAPWNAYEFAYHVLHKQANIVMLSMAWLTREDQKSFGLLAKEPDMETISYWIARLEPILRADVTGEIIIVLANRCGTEREATYAGTSAVLGIKNGEVRVYGLLGRGEEELLIVDTNEHPKAKIVSQARSAQSN